MTISRKHYRAAAAALNKQVAEDPNQRDSVRAAAKYIADMFATDNPRFDRSKFYRASGVE